VRCRLPAYPFERVRHWHDRRDHDRRDDSPARSPSDAAGQPPSPPSGGDRAGTGDPVVDGIRSIWAELLGIERIGADQDFFELGGHSLVAIQVLTRIRETFAISLPPDTLVEAPTLAELAERVTAARSQEVPSDVGEAPDVELLRLVAHIRDLGPDQVRAEIDRERGTQDIRRGDPVSRTSKGGTTRD
jgi:acyl carrier protein